MWNPALLLHTEYLALHLYVNNIMYVFMCQFSRAAVYNPLCIYVSHVSDKDPSVWLWLYLGHLDENSYSD